MKYKSLFAMAGALTGFASGELKLGASLPKVVASDHRGELVKIEPAEGADYLLVFFYPKALTGG